MAEFQTVIKQFERLCNSANRDCSRCGLNDMNCSIADIVKKTIEFEKRVMAWAAENPEPQYPTWLEFVKCKKSEGRIEETDNDFVKWMAETPIPADIAQKLGIEPKNNFQKPSLKREVVSCIE